MRVDALSDNDDVTLGRESRVKVEERMRQLEGRADLSALPGQGQSRAKPIDVYSPPSAPQPTYNARGDSTLGVKEDQNSGAGPSEAPEAKAKKAKKDKGNKGDANTKEKKGEKRKKQATGAGGGDADGETDGAKVSKKAKKAKPAAS